MTEDEKQRVIADLLVRAVVGLSQKLFLIRHDLRERVRVQYAVLGLIRETGGDGLAKQRDHMVEVG
jgi:hypothetical protein